MSFVWPLENLPVHAAKQFHGRRPDILLRPPSSKPSQPACCADRKKVRLVPAFGELQFPVLQLDASQLLQCLTCLRRCGSSKDALKVSLLEKGPLVLWKGHPDELLFRILTFFPKPAGMVGLPAEIWIKHIIPWCSRRWFECPRNGTPAMQPTATPSDAKRGPRRWKWWELETSSPELDLCNTSAQFGEF